MLMRDFENLRGDETLHEPEDVGVGASLNLAEIAFLVFGQEIELADLRESIGKKFLVAIEAAPANDILVDIPTGDFRGRNASAVADIARDCGVHECSSTKACFSAFHYQRYRKSDE